MAVDDVFATPERFEDYLSEIQARLAARRTEEERFLRAAIDRLELTLQEARRLGDASLERELAAQIAAAGERLTSLRPAPPPARGEEGAGGGLASARAGSPVAAAASPGRGPASPAHSLPMSHSATHAGASAVVAPPRSALRRPPRTWQPRPAEVIDREIEQIEARLDEDCAVGEPQFLRLKALSCRQRRAFWELEEQSAYAGGARALYGRLKARVIEEFGDRYVIPLNTNVAPSDPACWERLALRYEALATALEAFAWYRENAASLRPPEATSLLEAIGSTQQQFYRELESGFVGHHDDQQRRLYQALLDVATERRVRLESLSPDRTEAELESWAGSLDDTWQRLRDSQGKKGRQTACVAQLLAVTGDPSFGSSEHDPTVLRAAAEACLEAGIPASNREVRDALLPWFAFLDGEEVLAPLVREIQKELDRRTERGALHDEEDPAGEALSPEIQEMLAELLPFTRGKRCLFIGGDAREEKRRELEHALELSELVWPEARRTASVYDFEPEIARSDITALIVRFMRTGFKQAVDFCRTYDTRLVRLPRGLGLTRVITDFHQQLVPRAGADGAGG
jgi:hypothetical protein